MRKQVFGVSDQVRYKPGCLVTEIYYPCSEKKALISFAVTAKLICVFVFAYAKSRFSHDKSHMNDNIMFDCYYCINLTTAKNKKKTKNISTLYFITSSHFLAWVCFHKYARLRPMSSIVSAQFSAPAPISAPKVLF